MASPVNLNEPRFFEFVEKYLLFLDGKCYRHCEQSTRFVPLKEKEALVGAYVCPGGYVSRVVYFSLEPDSKWFETFLRDELGAGDRVRDRDVRVATRHGWELGGNAREELSRIIPKGGVKEYYWTLYPRSEVDKKQGTFLCGKCGKLFTQPLSKASDVCQRH